MHSSLKGCPGGSTLTSRIQNKIQITKAHIVNTMEKEMMEFAKKKFKSQYKGVYSDA